jgi:hypothetical protein
MVIAGDVFVAFTNALCGINSYNRKISKLNVDKNHIKIHILSFHKRFIAESNDDNNSVDADTRSTYIETIYTVMINIEKDTMVITTFYDDNSEEYYTEGDKIQNIVTGTWLFDYCKNAFSVKLLPISKHAKVKITSHDFMLCRNVIIKVHENAIESIMNVKDAWCKNKIQPSIFASVSSKTPIGTSCLCVNYSRIGNTIYLFDIIINSNTISLSVSCPRIVLELSQTNGIVKALIRIHKTKFDYCGTLHKIDAVFSLEKLPFDKQSLDLIANKIWEFVQIPAKQIFAPYSKSLFHPAIIIHDNIQRNALI